MSRVRWAIVVAILSMLAVWTSWPDGKLHVYFCDVGQGDASLVIKDRFEMLVDTGPSMVGLDKCLAKMPIGDREIEVVVNSHPQRDHWGAIGSLALRYKIDRYVTASTSAIGDVVRYGDLSFEVLYPGKDSGEGRKWDDNDASLVGWLTDGFVGVLYTGDIDTRVELALTDRSLTAKTKVLKVPHHGSKYGSSEEMLSWLRPDVAVVSVGEKNNYGHPTSETLMRLDTVGAKVMRTDKNGMVEIVCEKGECKMLSEK